MQRIRYIEYELTSEYIEQPYSPLTLLSRRKGAEP